MKWNYDFYIASSVVLIVLIIYYYRVAELNKLSRRIYGYFQIICLASCVTDMFSTVVLRKYFPDMTGLNYFGQMVGYTFQHLIPCMYFFYIVSMARDIKTIRKKMLFWAIPAIIEQVMIWTDYFTDALFSYSVSEGYTAWTIDAGSYSVYCLLLCSSYCAGIFKRKCFRTPL